MTIFADRLDHLIDRNADAVEDWLRAQLDALRNQLGLPKLLYVESGTTIALPPRFVCPECGARLWVEVDEWSTQTRIPTPGGYQVICSAETREQWRAWQRDEDPDPQIEHRWWQCDWQPIIASVGKFLVRRVRITHR